GSAPDARSPEARTNRSWSSHRACFAALRIRCSWGSFRSGQMVGYRGGDPLGDGSAEPAPLPVGVAFQEDPLTLAGQREVERPEHQPEGVEILVHAYLKKMGGGLDRSSSAPGSTVSVHTVCATPSRLR